MILHVGRTAPPPEDVTLSVVTHLDKGVRLLLIEVGFYRKVVMYLNPAKPYSQTVRTSFRPVLIETQGAMFVQTLMVERNTAAKPLVFSDKLTVKFGVLLIHFLPVSFCVGSSSFL